MQNLGTAGSPVYPYEFSPLGRFNRYLFFFNQLLGVEGLGVFPGRPVPRPSIDLRIQINYFLVIRRQGIIIHIVIDQRTQSGDALSFNRVYFGEHRVGGSLQKLVKIGYVVNGSRTSKSGQVIFYFTYIRQNLILIPALIPEI